MTQLALKYILSEALFTMISNKVRFLLFLESERETFEFIKTENCFTNLDNKEAIFD